MSGSRFELEQLDRRFLLAGNVFIPVAEPAGAVYDALRNRVYVVSGSSGVIQPFDVGTQRLLPPIEVGGKLSGLDLSPDGSTLYTLAAPEVGRSGGVLFAINVEAGTVVRNSYMTNSGETGGWSLAVAANGKVYFDGTWGGSGGIAPLKVFDPVSGSFSNLSSVGQNSPIARSGDHRYMIVGEGNISSGPLHVMDTTTGSRFASRQTEMFIGGTLAANSDGTMFAVPGKGVYSRDLTLSEMALPSMPAFVPGSDLIAGLDSEKRQLKTVSITTGQTVATYTLENELDWYNPFYKPASPTLVSPDGSTAFAPVKNGYEQVAMGLQPLVMPKFSIPETLEEGVEASLTATFAVPQSIEGVIEWDFDYDGTNFDVSATGANVSFVPANGPESKRVAVRRKVGERVSDVFGLRTVVTNSAPTATFGVAYDPEARILTARFENVVDAAADMQRGMRYSFDLDGDGIFEIVDSPSASASMELAQVGERRTVKGRVKDADGGFTDYHHHMGSGPHALISGMPETTWVGQKARISAAQSIAGSEPIVLYEWDFDFDGVDFSPNAVGRDVEYTVPDAGSASGRLGLRVTTGDGATDTTSVVFAVEGNAPVVREVIARPVREARGKLEVVVTVLSVNGFREDIGSSSVMTLEAEGGLSRLMSTSREARRIDDVTMEVTYRFDAPGVGWQPAMAGRFAASLDENAIRSGNMVELRDRHLGEVELAFADGDANAPDLQAEIHLPSATLDPRKPVKLSATVRNAGSAPSRGRTGVTFVFSNDPIYSQDDVPLKKVTATKVKAGASRVVTANVKMPDAVNNTDGYILTVLDEDVGGERSTVNNVSVSEPVHVDNRWFLDLVPTIKPRGEFLLKPGKQISFNLTLSNAGTLMANGKFTLNYTFYRLEADGEVETENGSFDIDVYLRPGQKKIGSIGGWVNDGTDVPGIYFIRYRFTYSGAVAERDVTDNVVDSPRVVIPG